MTSIKYIDDDEKKRSSIKIAYFLSNRNLELTSKIVRNGVRKQTHREISTRGQGLMPI